MTLAGTYTGIRVLDVSTNLAGPFAAMILGDLGADVIKVERPPGGDDTRALPPFRDGGQATVFEAVNRNKRSVLLDVLTGEGRDVLLTLARDADVLVESFGPGVAERFGLTAEALREVNPRLIVCSISAFGDGPLGGTAGGYDALVQAMTGMMSFTGHEGAPPVRVAPSVVDLSTGLWATIGIMAALAAPAEQRGAHVTPCLADSAFTLMCHQLLGFLATGEEPRKLGSQAPSAAPYAVYEAADGALMLATANDKQFLRLCEALELPGLAGDARFGTTPDRIAHRDELNAAIAARIAERSVDEWLERLGAARISAGPVNNLGAALQTPLLAEREIVTVPRPHWPPQLRLPIDPCAEGMRLPPPHLGEHTAEVLGEAGLTPR